MYLKVQRAFFQPFQMPKFYNRFMKKILNLFLVFSHLKLITVTQIRYSFDFR